MNLDFLVPIATYPDATPEEGLTRAIEMVASVTGQISVIVQEADIPPIDSPFAETLIDLPALAAGAEQRSREAGKRLQQVTRSVAERLSLPLISETARCHPGFFEDVAMRASRQHDAALLVMDPGCPGHASLAQAVLFGSGGPLLVCPPSGGGGHLRSVAIAWDGSRAAARALRDAVPLLRLASEAILLTSTEDKPIDDASVAGVKALLDYHSIPASVIDVPLGDRLIGEVLQEAALEHKAGLLVTGAYGHNRLLEFLLGGATRSILHRPIMPVFMSH